MNEALSHRIALPSAHGNGTPLRNGAIWSASIAAERMDGVVSYHADIFEHGVFVCRIVLSSCLKGEAAEVELNRRLHRWIADYEQRCEKSEWN